AARRITSRARRDRCGDTARRHGACGVNAPAARSRERLRQQQLLRALWRRGSDAPLALWLRETGERAAQGLAAYRGNAAALAERAHEIALVARDGWRASVQRIDDASMATFFEALLQGVTLARALDAAGSAFQFDRWLADALRHQWLAAIERTVKVA